MNELATIDQKTATPARLSITNAMASRFNMEGDAFMATLNATVFGDKMSREEKAAFLVVAWEYRLNPITREIYAMPKKGGGIIPVVSIDGWVRLANEHPAFDGMEFEDQHDGAALVSTTCRIFRKDRSHAIVVTEYLEECRRDTDPWKMKHRMLRHKSMIQCARYAFGFAGIYDPDEAERFADPLAGGQQQPQRRAPSPSQPAMIEAQREPETARQEQPREEAPKATQTARRAPSPSAAPTGPERATEPGRNAPQANGSAPDPEALRKRFTDACANAETREQLGEAWNDIVDPHVDDMFPTDKDDLDRIYRLRAAEIDGTDGVAP